MSDRNRIQILIFITCIVILLIGLAWDFTKVHFVESTKPVRDVLTAEQRDNIAKLKYRVVEPVDEAKESAVIMLAKLIYHEARNQPKEGQIMVCQVALNRCSWNLSYLKKALFVRNAFTGFEKAYASIKPTREQLQTAIKALEGKKLVSIDTKYYMNPKTATSHWIANRCLLVSRVKDHNFYKLKGRK